MEQVLLMDLSIAWAVVEYIAILQAPGAKTLFATHYHELTELEGKIPGVNNYCIAVKEKGDDIVFLRKIIKGSADKSYGVQVAKLAGVPEVVIESKGIKDDDIIEEIKGLDMGNMTPIEAMNTLYNLQNKIKNRW